MFGTLSSAYTAVVGQVRFINATIKEGEHNETLKISGCWIWTFSTSEQHKLFGCVKADFLKQVESYHNKGERRLTDI
uniref:Uncharacterized protein n=1 Tax=Romanomermis culicivorax TaxID=13658 RepID=A0A915IVC5_ROMCU